MSKEVNNSQHSRKVGVNRGIAALTALSLLATGCVATEGGQVQAKIIDEPTKTSPISPDFTKTPTPSPTEVNYELTPTVVNSATQELTLVSSTEVATEMPNVETGIDIKNIPSELNFIDGRNIKEMASSVGIDANTGLEVALNKEGNIVAYNLKTENKDLWVVNPLIEKGFKWNFDTNENGQYILHNALEEWKYKPYPIEGIKYVKPDQLPVTFWDESNPVKADESYPWPSEGTLAVFDGDGDVLMHYSKHENAWWYSGYQSELPGNMVFRQSSSSLALTGIRYKPVDESVWKGPDLKERWQEIRNSIDWLAYTRRTGNYISLENFSNRVSNGEVFEYQSWLFDLATNDYKLVTLNNKTRINFDTTVVGAGSENSYTDLFNGDFHTIGGYFVGTQLNSDNSISIIYGIQSVEIEQNRESYLSYTQIGSQPFNLYSSGMLAARDDIQKEGITGSDRSYYKMLSIDESIVWFQKILDEHPFDPPIQDPEFFLSQNTPIIFPQVQSTN